MQMHASCAARDGAGVVLLGPAGSGKSDLVLRLIQRGFTLVADDRVDIAAGLARAPAALAGLLEVRGLGILILPYLHEARVRMAVQLGRGARLPEPSRDSVLDVPLVHVDPTLASAPDRVMVALSCALGGLRQVAGAFA